LLLIQNKSTRSYAHGDGTIVLILINPNPNYLITSPKRLVLM
jgi:hypothetical protein